MAIVDKKMSEMTIPELVHCFTSMEDCKRVGLVEKDGYIKSLIVEWKSGKKTEVRW